MESKSPLETRLQIALDEITDLKNEIRQLQRTFVPSIQFPTHWRLFEGERATLACLYEAKGSLRTKQQLVFATRDKWHLGEEPSDNIVGVRVCNIRRKLRGCGLDVKIETITAIGYRLPLTERGKIEHEIELEFRPMKPLRDV